MSSDAVDSGDTLANRFGKYGLNIPNLSILGPLLAITVSEFALFFGYRGVALWGHLLTVLACLLAPLRVEDDAATLFKVFALVPLFRLVNLGMPVFLELTIYWFPLVYAPIIPGLYVVVSDADVPTPGFDPRTAAVYVLPAALVGVLLAHVEYAIIEPAALIPSWSLANLAVISVVMLGFVGFVEELLFRGILQETLKARVGFVGGLLVASFLFGMMHSAYATPLELLFAGVIGLVFGLVYEWTGSLLVITVAHGVLNVFLFGVIPLRGSVLPF
jgi:hypothetical protein